MRRSNVSSLTLPGKATWRLMVIALAGTMLVCCGGPGESGPTITPGPTNTPHPTSTESASKTSMPTMAIASPTDTATSSEKGDSPRFELQGVTESEMTVLLENFRDAINERDMDWLSRQIAYPITAEVNEKFLVIGSPNEFVRHYDQIINKTITEIVLGQEVSDLFVNSKGILIGGREYSMGAIWLAYRCTSSSCDADTMDCPLHIISINNVSLDGSSEPVYIPTPTPPALNPNPDLAGLWDVVKIHLPGSIFNDCGDIQKKTETIGAAQLSIHRDGTMEFLDATCEPVNLEYKIWDTDTYYRLLSGSAGTASPFWDGIRQPYVQVMYPHCEAWPSYALIYLNPTSIVFSWEKYHLVMSKGQNDLSVPIAPTAGPEAVLCDPGPFADCQRANLIGAHLSFADLREADLTTANLSGASLRGALLGYSQLTGANLSYADARGADLHGASLDSTDLSYADLRLAYLSDVNLDRAILSNADLRDADLSYAILSGAILHSANLEEADLRGANLTGADFSGADLRGATLNEAELRGAILSGADLSGADLSGADLYGVNYNAETKWPEGFDPVGAGAVLGPRLWRMINYFDDEEEVTLSTAGLTAVLGFRSDKAPFVVPTLRIWHSGQGTVNTTTEEPVLKYEGLGKFYTPLVVFQVAELDGSNDAPEVLLSEYSGGVHCCASVTVFSQDSEGIWQTIEVGHFDGEPFWATDIQGSDGYVIQTYDNRFLYQFDCYACSRAPRRIFAIESGQVADVSDRAAFVPLFREDARRMEEEMSEGERGRNGFWAGYVATKARAGEFDEAWEMMLANYDHESNWGLDNTTISESTTAKFIEGVMETTRQLKECSGSDDETLNCETSLHFKHFPEALEVFLKATGYISAERVVD